MCRAYFVNYLWLERLEGADADLVYNTAQFEHCIGEYGFCFAGVKSKFFCVDSDELRDKVAKNMGQLCERVEVGCPVVLRVKQ